MLITLIGYRGCGKSSVAPRLAEQLGWKWTDSDDVIEQQAGCSIRDIFEREGEPGFRRRETDVILQLLNSERLVIAAGGGAILLDINRQRMRAAGPVVWLTAPAEVLAARIAGDAVSVSRRPSLTGKSVTEEVAEILTRREPLYREAATMTFDTSALSPEAIAGEIARAVTRETSG